MSSSPQERAEQELGRTRRFWGAIAALSLVAVAALWLLWGFRWPPTAVVVAEDQEPEAVGLEEPAETGADPVALDD